MRRVEHISHKGVICERYVGGREIKARREHVEVLLEHVDPSA